MKRNILVVEDDKGSQSLIKYLLSDNYNVITAENGWEAVRLLKDKSDFDLIITDIEMPKLDGYGLIEAVADMPEYSSIPVIVVSSRIPDCASFRENLNNYMGYILKPLVPSELYFRIEESINKVH